MAICWGRQPAIAKISSGIQKGSKTSNDENITAVYYSARNELNALKTETHQNDGINWSRSAEIICYKQSSQQSYFSDSCKVAADPFTKGCENSGQTEMLELENVISLYLLILWCSASRHTLPFAKHMLILQLNEQLYCRSKSVCVWSERLDQDVCCLRTKAFRLLEQVMKSLDAHCVKRSLTWLCLSTEFQLLRYYFKNRS